MKNRIFCILLLWLVPSLLMGGPVETYEFHLAPDTGLVTNTAIEVIEHDGGVWLGTGKGIMYTFDDGQSWLVYNDANGLVSDDISALFSVGGRLWAGTNHVESVEGQLTTVSDGLSYSDDDGNTWTQVDFSPSGLDIPFVIGGNRTVFDITGHADPNFDSRPGQLADWLFFSGFAAGLMASYDGGVNWRRIYPTRSDSIQYNDPTQQPSLRNRNFSCAVDTSHGDTLMLWTGTAGGLFQYIFAPPRNKLFSRFVRQIALCPACGDSSGSRVLLAGENGFTYTAISGGAAFSRFESDGLPGRSLASVFAIGGRILAGTMDSLTGDGQGMAYSDDSGDSFVAVAGLDFLGPGRAVTDFASIGPDIFAAASEGGLYRSSDSGLTWQHRFINAADTAAGANHVNALAVLGDTLYVGTDSGFAALYYNIGGVLDSSLFTPFTDDSANAARIVSLRVQPLFNDSTPSIVDSVVIWAVAWPKSLAGAPSVYRSTTRGVTWSRISAPVSYDIGFNGDTAFVAGEQGIRLSINGSNASIVYTAAQYNVDSVAIDSLSFDTVTAVLIKADTILFGTRNGYAYSTDNGGNFTIVRPNLDSLKADAVVNYTAINTFDLVTQTFGVPGDFVPAVGVQYNDSGPANIWVSGRVVDFGGDGIGVGRFVPLTDTITGDTSIFLDFETSYFEGFAWNFAFSGDSTFAATNEGLLLHRGDFTDVNLVSWDTVALVDPASGTSLIDAGEPIFAVRKIGNALWLGTGDGSIRIDLANPTDQQLFQKVDSTTSADEVYAFPVPFRPRDEKVDFHFAVKQDSYITLEVYDFAMNLVARPIDHVFYTAGIYPNGSQQGLNWDGRNGDGDIVAVGVYYFKVINDNGDIRWGKLAVIP